MIGLLTPYAVANYGTKLQAYAVQTIIGRYDQVEIIHFSHSFPERVIRKFEKVRYKKYLDVKPDNAFVPEQISKKQQQRIEAINSFDVKYNLTPHLTGMGSLKKYIRKYQSIVCGSDQIWNPINLVEHIYMLEFAPKTIRKVAFSPSFGIGSIPRELESKYRHLLNSMDALSIREKSGYEIIQSLGVDKDCVWTLDPTLILDKEEWNQLSSESSIAVKGDYIFCYFLGEEKIEREILLKIQELTGLRIVGMPHFKKYVPTDEELYDVELYDVSPQDFIKLLSGAKIVCTDSFHGTVFSTIYKKPFVVCQRHSNDDVASTNERLISLLEMLNLEERLIKNPELIYQVLDKKIDFNQVDTILIEEKEKTFKYLKESLS